MRRWHALFTRRGGADGADRQIGDPQGHRRKADRADARGSGQGPELVVLTETCAHHLLPALADRGRGGTRQLLREGDARPGDAAAVRRGEKARRRFLSGLRRTGRSKTAASAASTPRSSSTAPAPSSANTARCTCRASPKPQPRDHQHLEKRYFEPGNLGFKRLARFWRRHGHVHLQRPPLARNLPRHGPSAGRDGHAWLQHALQPHRDMPTSTA